MRLLPSVWGVAGVATVILLALPAEPEIQRVSHESPLPAPLELSLGHATVDEPVPEASPEASPLTEAFGEITITPVPTPEPTPEIGPELVAKPEPEPEPSVEVAQAVSHPVVHAAGAEARRHETRKVTKRVLKRNAHHRRSSAGQRAQDAAWWHASAATRIGEDSALQKVRAAGVHMHSSGHCSDPRHPWCTSLQSIRLGTLAQVIDLRRRSGCHITITGGTETGHAPGVYSHGQGYKVDVAHNACVDGYITRTFRYRKVRGDGADLYYSDSGDIYADESDHWDILYR